MDGSRRTRRNLIVVKRGENILGITAIDSIAVFVEHKNINKVRPRIDFFVLIHPAAPSNHLTATGHRHIQPDFIGIGSSLGEWVSYLECTNHRFQQVRLAGFEFRNLRTQGSD